MEDFNYKEFILDKKRKINNIFSLIRDNDNIRVENLKKRDERRKKSGEKLIE